MVRLIAFHIYIRVCLSKFQFQNGSINSGDIDGDGTDDTCFNSKMVRLIAIMALKVANIELFQFQNGSINSGAKLGILWRKNTVSRMFFRHKFISQVVDVQLYEIRLASTTMLNG